MLGMDECIEYQGAKNKKGYGWRRYKGSPTLAHRAAWMEEVGDIPKDMTIHHICYNPPCINVKHLTLMSRSENSKDRTYTRKEVCKNGHPYTPENTRMSKDKRGYEFQACRTCAREREAMRRERMRVSC